MAKERENFGFYFSEHPVESFRDVASANGARPYASLMAAGAPVGGRSKAMMAAMVEKVNIGTTRKGAQFVRADFSDSSGQFSAACFEDSLVESFKTWAADGTCVLLTVELDSPSPDEPPRVTVRGARSLTTVSGSQRMLMTLEVSEESAIAADINKFEAQLHRHLAASGRGRTWRSAGAAQIGRGSDSDDAAWS